MSELGKEDSILSYKGMESDNKVLTGSNTSKFFKKGTHASNNTGSNSIRSIAGVQNIKEMRKKALQKKSTLLFIDPNHDHMNDPHSQNRNLNGQSPQNKFFKTKTMIDNYTNSKSFKADSRASDDQMKNSKFLFVK